MLTTAVSVFKKLPLTTTAIGVFAIYTTIRKRINQTQAKNISRELDENDLIDKLPTEILTLIFDWLWDPFLLLPVSATSKRWQTICDQLWPKKYEIIGQKIHRRALDYTPAREPLNKALSMKVQVFTRLQQWREMTGARHRSKRSQGIGRSYFSSRPEALLTVLAKMVTQPHPYYIDSNRFQAQATSKFFSIMLSLLPFVDQLLFWAPRISPQLWNYSPWAITTQIRMILSMFSMFAFDWVPTPGLSSMPILRLVLVAIFHLISIGFKGLLLTLAWCVLAGSFTYTVLRKHYGDDMIIFVGLLTIPFIPGLYFAPLHILLGYAPWLTLMVTLGANELVKRRGLNCMRVSLSVAVVTLLWTYIAAAI